MMGEFDDEKGEEWGWGLGMKTYTVVHAHVYDAVVAGGEETLGRVQSRLIADEETAAVDIHEHGRAFPFATPALEHPDRHDDIEEEAVFALGQGGVADGYHLAVGDVGISPIPGRGGGLRAYAAFGGAVEDGVGGGGERGLWGQETEGAEGWGGVADVCEVVVGARTLCMVEFLASAFLMRGNRCSKDDEIVQIWKEGER